MHTHAHSNLCTHPHTAHGNMHTHVCAHTVPTHMHTHNTHIHTHVHSHTCTHAARLHTHPCTQHPCACACTFYYFIYSLFNPRLGTCFPLIFRARGSASLAADPAHTHFLRMHRAGGLRSRGTPRSLQGLRETWPQLLRLPPDFPGRAAASLPGPPLSSRASLCLPSLSPESHQDPGTRFGTHPDDPGWSHLRSVP